MNILDLGDVLIHWHEDGDPDGAPLVLFHALGTDLRLWDRLVVRLLAVFPARLRILRFDMRGHGLSSCPPAPYAMGTLIRDAERVIDARGIREAVVIGISIGGLIAQGLAIKRLDQVRALVLSNTAVKIGTAAIWDDRIARIRKGGIEAIADATMDRWFPRAFRATPEVAGWRNMVTRTPLEGYCGASAAIAGTDFITPTSGLRLPTLAIAGSDDGSTPPDLVRELAGLIPGAEFALIRGAGHLPCIDRPDDYAAIVTDFLKAVGHVRD